MTPLPSHRIARQSRDHEAAVDQVHPFLEGSVPLYVLPRNIVAFLAAFWLVLLPALDSGRGLGKRLTFSALRMRDGALAAMAVPRAAQPTGTAASARFHKRKPWEKRPAMA